MITTTDKLRPVLLVALIPLLFTGCASEAYKAQVKKEKESKDDYVWYTPVGSNIPIKVPKDQAKASESETAQAQEVFRDVQRMGVKTPGDPESSAANAAGGQPGTR